MPWVNCTIEHAIEMADQGDEAYRQALVFARDNWPCVLITNTMTVEVYRLKKPIDMPDVLKSWVPKEQPEISDEQPCAKIVVSQSKL
jgi:hypothetical protein